MKEHSGFRTDLRFLFRGTLESIQRPPPQRTVLQWLREDKKVLGTKEGCNEGDCGACTVVVASLDAASPGGVRFRAVNSCLRFLPSLDGLALFTVEDLAADGALHPVQEAMVDLHGSQCGFCTPGFVMSLWADYETRGHAPTRDEAAQVLSGNLCRCTGYRPILDAAKAAWSKPEVFLDREPIRRALEELAAAPELRYGFEDPPSHPAAEAPSSGSGAGPHPPGNFFAPKSISSLTRILAERPGARLVSGGTDVGLWVTKQLRDLGDLVFLGRVDELKSLGREKGLLRLGAGLSLDDAFDALVSDEPAWTELALTFASKPIRNAGTLGGNVANGSPIGDSMPGLLALDSRLVLQRGAEVREIDLADFYLGYQKTALRPGEFLREILVPARGQERFFRTWKVSKRKDQDISAVCGAFAFRVDRDGRLKQVSVAYGGMAATPARAPKTEAALEGRVFDESALADAREALATDFSPLSDLRASKEYRLAVARNLLTRLRLEALRAGIVPGGLPDRDTGPFPLSLAEVKA